MRRVGDIEALSPELHTEALPDLKVTEDAGIHIGCARSTEIVETTGSEAGGGDWSECGRIEVRVTVQAITNLSHVGLYLVGKLRAD